MKTFWDKLPRPFFGLAPMADVTDPAFRRLIARCGKPDVFWTEFVSADGLVHPTGRAKLLPLLQFSRAERPIVAQIFGAKPEKIEAAAQLVAELGFDGLDLNFGCPDRAVEKQGAGAALIKNPNLAREIILAAQAGAQAGKKKLPVSVKTRLGYLRDEVEKWIPLLLETKPAALTIHARTRQEMSLVPARWERVRRVVEIRDALKSATLVIGNGDVVDMADGRAKAAASGADGVMLGRAIFGKPWLFAERESEPEPVERLRLLAEHIKLFDKLLKGVKSFAVMKKHFKAYVSGWPGAKEWRTELMNTETSKEAIALIHRWRKG